MKKRMASDIAGCSGFDHVTALARLAVIEQGELRSSSEQSSERPCELATEVAFTHVCEDEG